MRRRLSVPVRSAWPLETDARRLTRPHRRGRSVRSTKARAERATVGSQQLTVACLEPAQVPTAARARTSRIPGIEPVTITLRAETVVLFRTARRSLNGRGGSCAAG